MEIFERHGRVSRSDAVLRTILEAVNKTEEITLIAREIELFVQEYGLIAVHLRGLHRETGLVVIVKVESPPKRGPRRIRVGGQRCV